MSSDHIADVNVKKFPKTINWFLRTWQTSNLLGKYKIYQWLKKNYKGTLIEYNIDNRAFLVPVDEWCFWLGKGPENYYLDEFEPFCEALNQLNQPFVFFDLGADIGTASSLVAYNCPKLQNIIAFEPNPSSHHILSYNLAQISTAFISENKAVSDFNGYAYLNISNDTTTDHEGNIERNNNGNINVVSLDSWCTDKKVEHPKNLVLKIDVEGQERNTIHGAANLISHAQNVIILIEFHPDVLNSKKETPEDLMKAVEKIRSIKWMVPSYNNAPIDRSCEFFEQFATRQYDIIGIST